MKIIYYSPHPYLNLGQPSGYGTHMREMIGAFEKLGHEVLPVIAGGIEVVELKESKTSLKRKLINFSRILIPVKWWETVKDYRLMKFDKGMKEQLLSNIKKFGPDLIYERGNYLQNSGVLAAKETGVKHFLELNAPYISERQELQGSSSYLEQAYEIEHDLLEKSDAVFVISSSLKNHFLKEHKGIPENKINVVPNAINMESFKNDPALTDKLKSQYSISESDVVIGFVGSIFKWHGVDILIKAFYKISDIYPKAKLLIVGSGEVIDELKDLVYTLKIEHRVVFTGNVPYREVPSHIHLMDVTVIANTNWYCSPIKIFEYGLMKKAIVAPNYEPVLEVMNQNEDGLIVNPSFRDIGDALNKVLSNEALREELATNFYKKIQENYTWEGNAIKVLSFA